MDGEWHLFGRVAGVAAAVLAAFAAFLLLAPGRMDSRSISIADDAFFVVLTLTGAVSAALTARATTGRRRTAWAAMSVAMVAWFLGDLLWATYEIRGWTAFPSPADVPYLMYPIAAAVALLSYPTGRRSPALRTVLDGAIVASSLFIVSWLTGMAKVYRDSGLSRSEMVVSLAYPLNSIVLLTVAAVVVAHSDIGARLPLWLLAAGLACSALASGFFTYIEAAANYASGHLLDLGWAFSALMVVVAAWTDRTTPERSPRPDTVRWAAAWMIYVPLMAAAVVVAVVGAGRRIEPPVSVVSVALVVMVLTRQVLTDVENRRLMRTVSNQALHDPLTGLANRAYFQREMDRLRDCGVPVSVLALDLDDFKAVNDTYGHAAGDELLVEVAQRVQRCVRTEDTVARLGGDEFVVLLEGDHDYADDVATRLRRAFAEPVAVADAHVDVRFGIGIAAADGGTSGDDLLSIADMAMYETKRAQRGPVSPPPAPGAAISS